MTFIKIIINYKSQQLTLLYMPNQRESDLYKTISI